MILEDGSCNIEYYYRNDMNGIGRHMRVVLVVESEGREYMKKRNEAMGGVT